MSIQINSIQLNSVQLYSVQLTSIQYRSFIVAVITKVETSIHSLCRRSMIENITTSIIMPNS